MVKRQVEALHADLKAIKVTFFRGVLLFFVCLFWGGRGCVWGGVLVWFFLIQTLGKVASYSWKLNED